MIRVGIIGASGYVGMELVRILSAHPFAKISVVASRSNTKSRFSELYPSMQGIVDLEFADTSPEETAEMSDIVITALPHGVSRDFIPAILEKGIRVIDHSADFRYRDKAVYEKWYKCNHPVPELIGEAVYGLPEIYRASIKNARLVANPGCYPTCSIINLLPLIKNKLIDLNSIIIDSASGISGAGKKAETGYLFCECDGNYKAYNVSTHRHTSEIEQELSLAADEEIKVSFTPHLLPIKRGMMSTVYSAPADGVQQLETEELHNLYRQFYKDEYFVRIMPDGRLPEIKYSTATNFIDIGVVADKRTGRYITISSLDNLGKGAAAQAVQCMNIMYGLEERAGLGYPGLYI